ncbi:MAG: hypothetical protein ABJA82_12955 [Myxococcales bacterium]
MMLPDRAAMIAMLVLPAGLISALWGVGCFNPHVESGKLGCSPEGKECPDGFECGPGRLCFKIGERGGAGTGGDGASGSGGAGGGPSGTGGTAPRGQVGQTCLITNEGQATQTDRCDVGLECMNDCAGARCYKVCQGDGDCPQSACTRKNAAGTTKLCEVPFVMCNPEDTARGGCEAGFGCWLVAPESSPTGGDRTVCDCSVTFAGTGEPCRVTRDCFQGLVCPPQGSLGAQFCRRICDPKVGCSSGGTCRPFGAKWGYCFQ